MRVSSSKWSTDELAKAMEAAIVSNAHNRFLKVARDKILFNGFWRGGDKQNVCVWLSSATWHDAKTGEGGGCKDFARVVFNMELKEFMNNFGPIQTRDPVFIKEKSSAPIDVQAIDLNKIWETLLERDAHRVDHASIWLQKARGFDNPRSSIGSGFANLYEEDVDLFNSSFRGFLKQRLSSGPQLIAPIRSSTSDKVINLFFRSLNQSSKEYKSRLLPRCGGWGLHEDGPRAFGFPHLMKDFPLVILCEGMADYFAVECLLGQSSSALAIGVASASALPQWAHFLSQVKFSGHVVLLYQLDVDHHSMVSSKAIGQAKASEALKILLSNKRKAALFDWVDFLTEIRPKHIPRDIADVFLGGENFECLSSAFEKSLKRTY